MALLERTDHNLHQEDIVDLVAILRQDDVAALRRWYDREVAKKSRKTSAETMDAVATNAAAAAALAAITDTPVAGAEEAAAGGVDGDGDGEDNRSTMDELLDLACAHHAAACVRASLEWGGDPLSVRASGACLRDIPRGESGAQMGIWPCNMVLLLQWGAPQLCMGKVARCR